MGCGSHRLAPMGAGLLVPAAEARRFELPFAHAPCRAIWLVAQIIADVVSFFKMEIVGEQKKNQRNGPALPAVPFLW